MRGNAIAIGALAARKSASVWQIVA